MNKRINREEMLSELKSKMDAFLEEIVSDFNEAESLVYFDHHLKEKSLKVIDECYGDLMSSHGKSLKKK